MSFNIEVEGGSSVRLPTAGKYCDRDIVITALGGGGLPDGMSVFTLTLAETYPTRADGWELVIPHGLRIAPKFAIVLRVGGISNASMLRGWIGNADEAAPENIRMTNFSGFSSEIVSMQDSTATWLYADDTNLYCRSGGWGGNLNAGSTLFVGVYA